MKIDFDWWRFLPQYWIQNEKTSRSWDEILNKALDEFGISSLGYLTVDVGPWELWVGNWPYNYGAVYDRHLSSGRRNPLPKVGTRRRLKRMIAKFQEKALLEQFANHKNRKV